MKPNNLQITLAKKDANNQTPISNEANFGGDNFPVTTDKPTGDKHNSPIVCNKLCKLPTIVNSFNSIISNFTPFKLLNIKKKPTPIKSYLIPS